MTEIRWHGRGGQGAFTASKLFGEAVALYGGLHALAFPSFGPERRGAPVLAFTKISAEKIEDRSDIRKCDYIVILDESLFDGNFINDLKPEGKIIINTSLPDKYKNHYDKRIIAVDATGISSSVLGKPIANTAMTAVLASVSGIAEPLILYKALKHYFKDELLRKNMEIITRTFDISQNIIRQ